MRLASPWLLLLLLVVPLVWRGGIRSDLRTALRFPTIASLKAASATGAGRRRLALTALRTLALALVAIALARPQAGTAVAKVHREGVHVVLAVDVRAVWGHPVGAVAIPVFVTLLALAVVTGLVAAAALPDHPDARLRDVLRASLF